MRDIDVRRKLRVEVERSHQSELDTLIGSRHIEPFLNARNDLYRERNMKAQPPGREEAIALMAENPNLIRRPLLVSGNEIVYGFDEED